jgi:hypothetical protein
MSQFTDQQKKIFLIAGLVDIAIAIVLIGVIIGRENSSLPVVVPMLLIIPGIILVVLANKK